MKTWLVTAGIIAGIGLMMGCDDDNKIDNDGDGGSTSTSTSSTSTSTSSTSTSTTSSGSDCGSLVWSGDATCDNCMDTACCTQLLACDTGTACGDLFDCFDGCGSDTACQSTCQTTYSAGVPAAQALVSCYDTSCTDACGGGGICGSELGYESAALNECITDNCCASFDPCVAEADCYACLTEPTTTGCDTNTLYQTYLTCADGSCKTDFCDSGIGYVDGNQDPIFECNGCVDDHCCSYLESCMALSDCLTCLQNPSVSTCGSQDVVDDLTSFDSCVSSSCSTECGG